jgi:asparagine synthase (glutamine-hydrolysing)
MCGIAGMIALQGTGVCANALARVSERLHHRGPDDHGFVGWSRSDGVGTSKQAAVVAGRTVGLASRRLAIIDLSDAAAQPMGNRDGRYWIVYNGEVYNYKELRCELQAAGCQFQSASDTEVVLEAFALWGSSAFARFEGMFALAILDTQSETLLLARDQFGIKPLFIVEASSTVTFASEITPLLAFVKGQPRMNSMRAFQYLRFGRSDETADTMVSGINNLMPGHTLSISLTDGTVGPQRPFWELRASERSDLSFAEAASITREKFLRNVELHLRSDVPVGACLSGGVDSSACVAAMRYVKGKELDLQTFTYSAGLSSLDETQWARIVADSAGARSHFVTASAEELTRDLDALIRTQGEPFATTSIFAQHLVFRLISDNGVKVVLDGQGADEMLGGYSLFFAARIASAARRGRLKDAWRLSRLARTKSGFRNSPMAAAQFLLPNSFQEPLRRMVGRELMPAWVNQVWFDSLAETASKGQASRPNLFQSELIGSLKGSLRALLRYEDRNSMAASVESRLPFLTPALAEFFLSLPEEYLISSDGSTKAVFRAAMRGIVPDVILDRRDKISFQTPESNWMSQLSHWAEPILTTDFARACPMLDFDKAIRAWYDALRDSRRYKPWLWRWVNLLRWAEINGIAWSE